MVSVFMGIIVVPVILYPLFYFVILIIRRNLSGWIEIERLFPGDSEPDAKSTYGIHAAYYQLNSKYPLADTFAKIKVTPEGFYFNFHLFFEIPKVYKPVFIPWQSIKFEKSTKFDKFGFDKYHIFHQDQEIGMICIQPFVSKDILSEIDRLNVQLTTI